MKVDLPEWCDAGAFIRAALEPLDDFDPVLLRRRAALDTVRDDGVVAGGAVDAIARSGPAGGISEEDQQP